MPFVELSSLVFVAKGAAVLPACLPILGAVVLAGAAVAAYRHLSRDSEDIDEYVSRHNDTDSEDIAEYLTRQNYTDSEDIDIDEYVSRQNYFDSEDIDIDEYVSSQNYTDSEDIDEYLTRQNYTDSEDIAEYLTRQNYTDSEDIDEYLIRQDYFDSEDLDIDIEEYVSRQKYTDSEGKIITEYISPDGKTKGKILTLQEEGKLNFSEVKQHLGLGAVGTYKNILRTKRSFVKGKYGDKYHAEADHIPPLDSLRRAENEPEFLTLHETNPALYAIVISLRKDTLGRNLLTVQVCTHHHREALSTGNSKEAAAARGVLARHIARGKGKVMLKQAMIIAHPYVSRQIRNREIKLKPPKILISMDDTMDIYRDSFLEVIQYYCEKGVINESEKLELEEYVERQGYFDSDSSEYKEILEAVNIEMEKKKNK